ncbi:unnamed protein product, partial [Meganyctiphanes norvegica]
MDLDEKTYILVWDELVKLGDERPGLEELYLGVGCSLQIRGGPGRGSHSQWTGPLMYDLGGIFHYYKLIFGSYKNYPNKWTGPLMYDLKGIFLAYNTFQTLNFPMSTRSTLYMTSEITMVSGNKLKFESGGLLMLGQEQDTFNGAFNIEQTIYGVIANLMIVPTVLTIGSMKDFARCKEKFMVPSKNISFQNLDHWEIFGKTNFTDISSLEVCGEQAKTHVMFPELRTLEESQDHCQRMKGYLSTPENEEENDLIVTISRPHLNKCLVSWGVYLWIGIEARAAEDGTPEYISLKTNKSLSYNKFRTGYTNSVASYTCVFYDAFEIGWWVVYPCNFKTCTVCTFDEIGVFRLRGLCDDSLIDRQYVIRGMENTRMVLSGVYHSSIYWNNNTWVLRDTLYPDIQGFMESKDSSIYPLGLHTWKITGDRCLQKILQLKLTACQAHQFTCDDGTCIRKMQRCNLEVYCPDQSDERLCQAVVVPKDYIQEVPPARVGRNPAQVQLQVTILSLQPIDLHGMKVTLDATLNLKWRDPRLDMESLNYAETLNVIHDESQIWRPILVFEDATGSEADGERHWENFVAVMESSPLPDDINNVREDEVYPGALNSLKLTQTYSITFSCQMWLQPYPFDIQRCRLNIRLNGVTKDFVVFNASKDSIQYQGAQSLREYSVEEVSMGYLDFGNFSCLSIVISLENLSGFYISSTYIPTFLMVIICYSTFYFDIEDFNDRIMVSLTALLVLATLFTQITGTTPKTAYLKLLDIWFVATILINFTIVVLLVIINYFKMREASTANRVVPFKTNAKKQPMYEVPVEWSLRLNYISQIAVPIAVLMFACSIKMVLKLDENMAKLKFFKVVIINQETTIEAYKFRATKRFLEEAEGKVTNIELDCLKPHEIKQMYDKILHRKEVGESQDIILPLRVRKDKTSGPSEKCHKNTSPSEPTVGPTRVDQGQLDQMPIASEPSVKNMMEGGREQTIRPDKVSPLVPYYQNLEIQTSQKGLGDYPEYTDIDIHMKCVNPWQVHIGSEFNRTVAVQTVVFSLLTTCGTMDITNGCHDAQLRISGKYFNITYYNLHTFRLTKAKIEKILKFCKKSSKILKN